MADQQTQVIRLKILKLRKQLSTLEARRSAADSGANTDIWQAFFEINAQLAQFEQRLVTINEDITSDIHQHRQQILVNLTEYNDISQAMRDMEKFFMVNFLRPGYVLKQATRQREYLEREYSRIQSGIVDHQYHSLQEVESEIRNVLVHSDNAFEADNRSFKEEQVDEVNLGEILESLDPNDVIEDYDESQITDDFKRIVLPAVHPDTSETPKDTFLTVMAAYKTKDYLLMEAYVVQYRGEIKIDEEPDLLIVHEILSQRQREYHQLSERMDRRLKAIKKELDPKELDHPQMIKDNILNLREEIKRSIQLETEKIFELRNKIQELSQLYIQVKKTGDE